MSIVGPRPLLVKYLPLYNEQQRHRHDVRPGLTGWAQVHGRNSLVAFSKAVIVANTVIIVFDCSTYFESISLK